MPRRSEFVDYLLELLAPLGEVRARAMFGGHGIYLGELMFALVAGEVCYLKTDAESRPAFAERGLPPFSYERSGRPAVVMSYHRLPEEALEDGEEMLRWAKLAVAAALRAAAPARARRSRRR